jgi:uncharacterized protein HemX
VADAEPRLRTVPEPKDGESEQRGGDSEQTGSRLLLLLGIALSVALVLLVWSRLQLGNRIDVLETEARALKQTIIDREATIAEQSAKITAREERLGEVRGRVEGVLDLLSQPLEGGP